MFHTDFIILLEDHHLQSIDITQVDPNHVFVDIPAVNKKPKHVTIQGNFARILMSMSPMSTPQFLTVDRNLEF